MDGRINSTRPEVCSEIAIVDWRTIYDKICIVHGIKVILDFNLAEICGYSAKALSVRTIKVHR
ncbi:MAG: hypothetical protein IJ242_14475 [Clostridia bacterium]|nr:hypothetical protein [Clostridia bacterium]